MKTIWKYPFEVTDEFALDMPGNCDVLSVQIQNGQPCLWALVDSEAPLQPYAFCIYVTGDTVAWNQYAPEFVGSFQMQGGALVFHLFRAPRGEKRLAI